MKKKDMKMLTIISSNTKSLDVDRIISAKDYSDIEIRSSGEFKDLAYYLPGTYEWEIGYDSFGHTILVALSPQEDENPGGTLLKKG